MRKNIQIGEKTFTMDCSLGTAYLYRCLTGNDLMEVFTKLGNLKREAQPVIAKMVKKEQLTAEERQILFSNTDLFKEESREIAYKMAYVMTVQGAFEDPSEHVEEMEALMTEKDYRKWTFKVGMSEFDAQVQAEIIGLWTNNQKTLSESKN